MLGEMRTRTAARDLFVVLAILALAFKLLFPPGFMPGSSLAQPIMLCSGQGPMPAMAMPGMAHDGGHRPGDMPHGNGDHPCPFAGLGATPLAPHLAATDLGPALTEIAPPVARLAGAAPGRGMAAPPPPSHAPPVIHA